MTSRLSTFIFITKRKIFDSTLVRRLYSFTLAAIALIIFFPNRKKALFFAMAASRAYKNRITENLVLQETKRGFFKLQNKRLPLTDGNFGSRCFILKEYISKDEKGVLLLKFNSTIRDFPLHVDMPKFLLRYHLVLEPSWTGFVDEDILQYSSFEEPIWVLSSYAEDYEFIKKLNMNLIPVRLGPCDWVDPKTSEEFLQSEKQYDIVFNANWAPWKRHHVLFSQIARMQRKVKLALIGVEWEGRTLKDILTLTAHYGIRDCISVFERISFLEVQRITSSSKVSILLSKKEGSNRALAEAMMCNVPVIALKDHIGGIVKNITTQTGILIDESNLATEIEKILDNKYNFSPRSWAVENASCHSSTTLLNDSIKSTCKTWTQDIYVRANSPEPIYVGLQESLHPKPFNTDQYRI